MKNVSNPFAKMAASDRRVYATRVVASRKGKGSYSRAPKHKGDV